MSDKNDYYLAIDIGGTKTLLAAFDSTGEVVKSYKFPTNQNYQQFLDELKTNFQTEFGNYEFLSGCCAVPARLSDDKSMALAFGNLPWQNISVKKDISDALGLQVIIENDAKLAGLSEAHLAKQYRKVLYLTISTGIGAGVIIDGVIDPNFDDTEPGQMMFEHDGQVKRWEQFGSGKAMVERFGKRASEIEDEATWKIITHDMAIGIYDVLANIQPDAVVIGGGVGAHFDKFGHLLKTELEALQNGIVGIPPILGAKHPEEAVVYGCFELIKQQLAKTTS